MTQTLYAGMAGDTDEGRFVSAGLYRRADDGAWERSTDPSARRRKSARS